MLKERFLRFGAESTNSCLASIATNCTATSRWAQARNQRLFKAENQSLKVFKEDADTTWLKSSGKSDLKIWPGCDSVGIPGCAVGSVQGFNLFDEHLYGMISFFANLSYNDGCHSYLIHQVPAELGLQHCGLQTSGRAGKGTVRSSKYQIICSKNNYAVRSKQEITWSVHQSKKKTTRPQLKLPDLPPRAWFTTGK